MKKTVRLTENDLTRLVKQVMKENNGTIKVLSKYDSSNYRIVEKHYFTRNIDSFAFKGYSREVDKIFLNMTPSLNVRFVKYIYKYFRLRLVIKKKYLSKSRYHSSFKYFFIALSTDDNLHRRFSKRKSKPI